MQTRATGSGAWLPSMSGAAGPACPVPGGAGDDLSYWPCSCRCQCAGVRLSSYAQLRSSGTSGVRLPSMSGAAGPACPVPGALVMICATAPALAGTSLPVFRRSSAQLRSPGTSGSRLPVVSGVFGPALAGARLQVTGSAPPLSSGVTASSWLAFSPVGVSPVSYRPLPMRDVGYGQSHAGHQSFLVWVSWASLSLGFLRNQGFHLCVSRQGVFPA